MNDPLIEESFGEDRDLVYTSLDDREALERQLADPRRDAERTLHRWRDSLAGVTTEDGIRQVANDLGANRWDPIEGTSWRRWAQSFESRLVEAVTDPSSVLPSERLPAHYTWRRRRTTPVDETRSQLLAREAVDANVEVVSTWLASSIETGTSLRLVHASENVQGHVDDLTSARFPREQQTVRSRFSKRISVSLHRTSPGDPRLVTRVCVAEPAEDSRANSWRRTWPALSAALGGHFGDDPRMVPSLDQQHMLFTEPPAFLERLAAEGEELLTLADDDLHAAVVALGSFVEPPHLRLWLTWMFWRIRTFDWNPDDLAP